MISGFFNVILGYRSVFKVKKIILNMSSALSISPTNSGLARYNPHILLSEAFTANRVELALQHYQRDTPKFYTPEKRESYKRTICRGLELLDKIEEAHLISTARKMRGFTEKGIQLRIASLDVAAKASSEGKRDYFSIRYGGFKLNLLEYVSVMKEILYQVLENRINLSGQEVERAKNFFKIANAVYMNWSRRIE